MADINVVAVDVGALRNIGWWRATSSGQTTSGRDLDDLVLAVAADLNVGIRVALGFEAPLFIPTPPTAEGLNRQRVGDRGRPWCAGAGTGALALGIQQSAYVFRALARETAVPPRVTFDPSSVEAGDADLLIWEAFVSGSAKNRSAPDPHIDDARRAVDEFRSRLTSGELWSDINEPAVLNLAAAGLLAAGLASDVALLTEACVVIKPPDHDPLAEDLQPGSDRP